jgi:hypothetical protein
MDTIVQLLSTIAWPVTVIVLAMIFRKEFRQLLKRLTTFSYKEATAEFKHDLDEVEGEIKSLPKSQPQQAELESMPKKKPESLEDSNRLIRISEISPRAAVMEAWREVEIGTKQVTDAYGIPTTGQVAGIKAINELTKRGLLSETFLSIYERLRRLRSRAAHAPDFVVEEEQARRFIEAANQFHEAFQALLKQEKANN